jgi:hypothetical protein
MPIPGRRPAQLGGEVCSRSRVAGHRRDVSWHVLDGTVEMVRIERGVESVLPDERLQATAPITTAASAAPAGP